MGRVQRTTASSTTVDRLRAKRTERLTSGLFRRVNEKLYTTKSSVMMREMTPELFEIYHRGYSQQVAKWPMNPTDAITEWVLRTISPGQLILDVGCGQALLAEACKKHQIRSFDLVAASPVVEVASAANLPVESDSADVAIFCLSLMGSDWPDFIYEAHRVLKTGGILKIAEVSSRVESKQKLLTSIAKVGFRMVSADMEGDYFIVMEFRKEGRGALSGKIPSHLLSVCKYRKR